MENIDYVFCLTGRPTSYDVTLGLTEAMVILRDKGKKIAIKSVKGNNIYDVRNGCLKEMENGFRTNQKPFEGLYNNYDRIIWVDSDNIIKPEHVQKLLNWDVDIVCGWYKILGDKVTSCGVNSIPYTFEEMSKMPEIIEVDWSGMGLMIVKKGVFESMEYPWFKSWVKEFEDNGQKMSRIVFDDECFCDIAREKGYKIFVDTTCYIEHEKLGFM